MINQLKCLGLRQFLAQSTRPIVADGGMTTSLYDKGFYINRSFEELSVTHAEAVREVTMGFKRSGAELLTTNTFGATYPKLTEYGLQDRLIEILQASVKIAKGVADGDAYVLGSVGPLGVVLEPLGPTSRSQAFDWFLQNFSIMAEEGVDGFVLEGFHDLKEMQVAIQAAKQVSSLPIFAYMGIQESKKSSFGHRLDELITLVDELDADVLGLAGEVGPSGMLSALEVLRPLTKKPIALLPNAGLPRYVNNQYIYLCNPDYMGKYAKRLAQAGANIIGGHCGVSENHIRAIANAVRMTQSLQVEEPSFRSIVLPPTDKPKEPLALEHRSKLGSKLKNGECIYTVEINPPRGVDYGKFIKHCQDLEQGGVEFVNIPDGARAMARMSSTQLSTYVAHNFNLEPIPHFTTRDRNLIGLQSDLLGAFVNDVRNLLLVTGDPPKLGNTPGATGVYDVDAIGLTHIVSRMNQGLDLGGSSFGKPTAYTVGVALNPTAANQNLEISRFRYKVEAGADFAITQPIYDLEAYQKFFEQVGESPIPIIMGIWPLASLRNAEFLKNEVPGVEVPDWALSEMEKANGNKEESIKRGLDIAIRTMEKAQGWVQGFQVSAPFNKVEVALAAIGALRS